MSILVRRSLTNNILNTPFIQAFKIFLNVFCKSKVKPFKTIKFSINILNVFKLNLWMNLNGYRKSFSVCSCYNSLRLCIFGEINEKYKHFYVLAGLLIILVSLFSLNGCSFGVKPFPKTEQRNNMNLRKRLSLYLNF